MTTKDSTVSVKHDRLGGAKFLDPAVTADGSPRATVEPDELRTVWFNTGTRCNIVCRNCYIESSPDNDRLAYITSSEVREYLDEIVEQRLPVREIGFTGGEPFVNPQFLEMLQEALDRGFETLTLTNAMRPMCRPHATRKLLLLQKDHGARLHIRVSLDHYTPERHDSERGTGSWKATIDGLRWLAGKGFHFSVAGRARWGESEREMRAGYGRLFASLSVGLASEDPAQLVLFPEMDSSDVPEITTGCWRVLGISPRDLMCAWSRMVVKRREAQRPSVVACTLVPYDPQFELGERLTESLRVVPLNHPHCARFCVLGGGSCSVT